MATNLHSPFVSSIAAMIFLAILAHPKMPTCNGATDMDDCAYLLYAQYINACTRTHRCKCYVVAHQSVEDSIGS